MDKSSDKPRKISRSDSGRDLAGQLFDCRLRELMNLSAEQKAGWMAKFPKLQAAEFDSILEQVIAAKQYEQERVGWQAVPHDAAVLVTALLTGLADLRTGVIAGVAVLVLLESLFQFVFDRRLYRFLSALVWLTYPAYAWMAFVLYRRGFELPWIAVVVVLVWGGTFLLGILARLPVRLILDAKAKSAQEAVRHKPG